MNLEPKFQEIKEFVFGKEYELELVFLSKKEIQKINKGHRGKDYPTNVLSFPLSENAGQVFMCMDVIEEEAPKFGRKLDNFILFLFIHCLVHLKGMDHGSTMEAEERKIREEFGI